MSVCHPPPGAVGGQLAGWRPSRSSLCSIASLHVPVPTLHCRYTPDSTVAGLLAPGAIRAQGPSRWKRAGKSHVWHPNSNSCRSICRPFAIQPLSGSLSSSVSGAPQAWGQQAPSQHHPLAVPAGRAGVGTAVHRVQHSSSSPFSTGCTCIPCCKILVITQVLCVVDLSALSVGTTGSSILAVRSPQQFRASPPSCRACAAQKPAWRNHSRSPVALCPSRSTVAEVSQPSSRCYSPVQEHSSKSGRGSSIAPAQQQKAPKGRPWTTAACRKVHATRLLHPASSDG